MRVFHEKFGYGEIIDIDGNKVDLPPARIMLVVHNLDVPNMIGGVTSTLGGAGINISDIHVGRSPAGEAALMAIATDGPVPGEIVDRINEIDGVSSARSIDLGA